MTVEMKTAAKQESKREERMPVRVKASLFFMGTGGRGLKETHFSRVKNGFPAGFTKA